MWCVCVWCMCVCNKRLLRLLDTIDGIALMYRKGEGYCIHLTEAAVSLEKKKKKVCGKEEFRKK